MAGFFRVEGSSEPAPCFCGDVDVLMNSVGSNGDASISKSCQHTNITVSKRSTSYQRRRLSLRLGDERRSEGAKASSSASPASFDRATSRVGHPALNQTTARLLSPAPCPLIRITQSARHALTHHRGARPVDGWKRRPAPLCPKALLRQQSDPNFTRMTKQHNDSILSLVLSGRRGVLPPPPRLALWPQPLGKHVEEGDAQPGLVMPAAVLGARPV